jgi:hypothetical protein
VEREPREADTRLSDPKTPERLTLYKILESSPSSYKRRCNNRGSGNSHGQRVKSLDQVATPLLNDTMTQAKYLCGSAGGRGTPTMLAPARRPQPHHLLRPRRRRRCPAAAVDWSLDDAACAGGAYAGRGGTRGGRAAGRGCGRGGGGGGGSMSFLAVTVVAAAVGARRTVPLLRPSLLCRAR